MILFLLLSGFSLTAQSIQNLSFGTDTTLDVMTWNIEWFPKNGQNTINYVTQLIEALDIDILAIQEVNDVGSFNQMVDSLQAYDGYLESAWFAGLAYIYKSAVIQINDIYEIYTESQYWSAFPRSPMVMDMKYQNERIIIINNHFKCCGDEFLDLANPNDEETRRYHASVLLKEYIDTYFPNEKVIVLGDLNDVLSDSHQNNVFQPILDDVENYLFADYDIAMGDDSEWSYPTWPSHMDHILITNELLDDFASEGSAISTIKIDEYLAGGWHEYDANISDHRPVALRLHMKSNTGLAGLSASKPYFTSYPNPFNSETTFSLRLPNDSNNIEILNMQGQRVFSETIQSGESSILWNAKEFPKGIYVAILRSKNNIIASLKLILI